MEELLPLYKSKLKVAILKLLKEDKMSPVMISKKLDRPRSSVSRSILELEELGWVECTNPDADRWRMYRISPRGTTKFAKFKGSLK